MKRVALYARVSTKGQADNYSFGMQEADCENYAHRQADAMTITQRLVVSLFRVDSFGGDDSQ